MSEKRVEQIQDYSYWSLNEGEKNLQPLVFSNGKTQEDVVREIIELTKKGRKAIFLYGACGSGKSAVALNIARIVGRASIVVPVKALQRQYEEDYMSKKYVLKKNGEKLKIAMITGRENHDSVFMPGVSCADPFLPDTIKITEKNSDRLYNYYQANPIIKNKGNPSVRELRRISIAPTNPYWSPIVSVDRDLSQLKDAKKKKYKGLNGRDFIFYHRKEGCSYYDQYQSYIDADVIIFNSAKYKIENLLNRKPATDIEIIDEADEFLDSFSSEEDLNLTRLMHSLQTVNIDDRNIVDMVIEKIKLEEKRRNAIGIDEDDIIPLKDTFIGDILKGLLSSDELEVELSFDEMNYGNKAIEIAREFIDYLDDSYVSFRRSENNLYANIVTVDISKKLKEVMDKNKCFVFMSGTLHSEEVLRNIFGIDEFAVVEAEKLHQGTLEIHKTGKEFDCKYANFASGKKSREDYIIALMACMNSVKKPALVHVNAFEDLPTREEIGRMEIKNVMSREELKDLQFSDKDGKMVSLFKSGLNDVLFTTKCNRGVDFPGEMCNSVVFTKYPNPNIQGTFWKILQRTHPTYFWDFYRDKARREFLQRIYRALRSKDDHVFVLSPDSRVLDAVRDLQLVSKYL